MSLSTSNVTVGFGTAALGGNCYHVVTMALEAGFRRFDTAEADWWYDQQATGKALQDFFTNSEDDLASSRTCKSENLQISTKIPPWSLTSVAEIRQSAANSRRELVGFCEDEVYHDESGQVLDTRPFPLDIYYIHAPRCWDGWHPRCQGAPPTLPLREAWRALEAALHIDGSMQRIGLSNISPQELLDIIQFAKERESVKEESYPPARVPDVVQAFADPLSPNTHLRRICQDHGIEFVSYSTLGTQHRDYPQNPVLGSPLIIDMAQRYSRSTAEVVLSWAMQRHMSVIPRSSKKVHIEELARLMDREQQCILNEDDLIKIDGMSLEGTS